MRGCRAANGSAPARRGWVRDPVRSRCAVPPLQRCRVTRWPGGRPGRRPRPGGSTPRRSGPALRGAPRRGAVTMWTRSGGRSGPHRSATEAGSMVRQPHSARGPFDSGGGCHWSRGTVRANLSRSCQAEGTARPRSRQVMTTWTSYPSRLSIASADLPPPRGRQQAVTDDGGVAVEATDLLEQSLPRVGGPLGQSCEARVVAHHETGVDEVAVGATGHEHALPVRPPPGCGAARAGGRSCPTSGCRRGGRRARSWPLRPIPRRGARRGSAGRRRGRAASDGRRARSGHRPAPPAPGRRRSTRNRSAGSAAAGWRGRGRPRR